MDLNDLLAEVDGIGGDSSIPSPPVIEAENETIDEPPHPMSSAPAVQVSATLAGTPAAETFDVAMDVGLELTVELGQTTLSLDTLMQLGPGATLSIERGQDDQLKIFVSDQLIALGEPLIVDGKLAVKVTELVLKDEAEPLSC